MTSLLELTTLDERVADMARFAEQRRRVRTARSRPPRLIRFRHRPVLFDPRAPQHEVATAAK